MCVCWHSGLERTRARAPCRADLCACEQAGRRRRKPAHKEPRLQTLRRPRALLRRASHPSAPPPTPTPPPSAALPALPTDPEAHSDTRAPKVCVCVRERGRESEREREQGDRSVRWDRTRAAERFTSPGSISAGSPRCGGHGEHAAHLNFGGNPARIWRAAPHLERSKPAPGSQLLHRRVYACVCVPVCVCVRHRGGSRRHGAR